MRHIRPLALLAVVLCVADARAQAPLPTNGWTTATPASQAMNAARITSLDQRIRAGEFGYVDRMVIVRNGFLITDERYAHDYAAFSPGRDSTPHQYLYTHPDHHPWYMGRDVHTLQSVTKSITSALIGIAIGRGEIAGTDALLLSFLQDYDVSRVDPRLRRARLEDVLTMRTGIEWHEWDRPLDLTNTTLQLEYSQDWVQFTLDQPMDAAPGEKFTYNSGGSHLMSAIIRRATGVTVDVYAERHLFGPLGIRDYHWKKTPRGLPDTEGGLYLEARDLAKIGLLYLEDGVWDGQRILPPGWVRTSTSRIVELNDRARRGYGYQWWRIDRNGETVWAGLGFGGQFLVVLPRLCTIGVINSWNLFGAPQSAILTPFIDTLVTAATTPDPTACTG